MTMEREHSVSLRSELVSEYDNLPEDARAEFKDLNDFVNKAVGYYLERTRRAARFGFREVVDNQPK